MAIAEDFEVGAADQPLMSRAAFDGVALMQVGVAKLLDANVDTHHVPAAVETIDSVELLGRQADAAKIKVFSSVNRTGVYAVDGHRGAKPMIAHAAKLSPAEANAR